MRKEYFMGIVRKLRIAFFLKTGTFRPLTR